MQISIADTAGQKLSGQNMKITVLGKYFGKAITPSPHIDVGRKLIQFGHLKRVLTFSTLNWGVGGLKHLSGSVYPRDIVNTL